jgi:hypothetical protein
MGVEMITVFATMILVSLLFWAWKKRFAVLSIVILLGSVYLLLTSDMFLVIRLPTACVVGMGFLVMLWALSSPLMQAKRKQIKPK